jgi:hypothetical protein
MARNSTSSVICEAKSNKLVQPDNYKESVATATIDKLKDEDVREIAS